MARALNFEEWSGELSDSDAWIEFPDGSLTQTPMQVFTGWISHIVRPLIQPLIDRVTRLETEVSNLRAAEIGHTRTIEELVGRIDELEEENNRLRATIDSLISDVNAGDAELNSRIDSILRVDQQYAMLTTLLVGTRADRIPAGGFIDTLPPTPAPAPEPTPAPETRQPAAAQTEPALAKPTAQTTIVTQITDDNVRDLCIDVCRELGRPTNIKMVEKCLTYNRTHGHDRLRQEILNYFKENTVKNDILRGANVENNTTNSRQAYQLTRRVMSNEITLAQAVEEMKQFMTAQPITTPAGVDPDKMRLAFQEIAAIAHEEGFTRAIAGENLDRDITDFATQLASTDGQQTEEVRVAARRHFNSAVSNFKLINS